VAHYGSPAWTDPTPGPELSIVDRLFLLTHNPNNGKLNIDLKLLGLGLVGGSLLELAMERAISIEEVPEGQPVVVRRTTRREQPDAAAEYVLERIYDAEKGRPPIQPIEYWMTELRDQIYLGAAESLRKRQLIVAHKPTLGGVRYVPRQRYAVDDAISQVYSLMQSPHRSREAGERPVLLTCLVGALGLGATITALPQPVVAAGYPELLGQIWGGDAQVIQQVQRISSKLAMSRGR
jgi:Golgi phosphoprotein 3 (GPP34)